MKIIKVAILSSCLLAAHSYATAVTPVQTLNCSQLPTGEYDISSFGSYAERQANPSVKDITQFYVTQVNNNSVKGYVVLPNKAKATFTASCEAKYYENQDTQNIYPEIYLVFNSDQAGNPTKLDNCSGIFNFSIPSQSVGSAMYIGAPSLITGDSTVSPCINQAYGTITPPSSAVKDYTNN